MKKATMTLGELLNGALVIGFKADRDKAGEFVKKNCPLCEVDAKKVLGEDNMSPWIDTKQAIVFRNINNKHEVIHACRCGYRFKPGAVKDKAETVVTKPSAPVKFCVCGKPLEGNRKKYCYICYPQGSTMNVKDVIAQKHTPREVTTTTNHKEADQQKTNSAIPIENQY